MLIHIPQRWSHQLLDADTVYKGFVAGCALAGPEGCAVSTASGQTALDVDANVQAVLSAAHAAATGNASVSVTSDRKSTRLNSSHSGESRMPSSA